MDNNKHLYAFIDNSNIWADLIKTIDNKIMQLSITAIAEQTRTTTVDSFSKQLTITQTDKQT